VNKATITGEFFLALLFNMHREKYLYLYNPYKQAKARQAICGGKTYIVEIQSSYVDNINNFVSTVK